MGSGAAILEWDPDLGEDLTDDRLEVARERAVAEVVDYPAGVWAVEPEDFDPVANLGLLVLDGLLAREVTVGRYTCAELLGPGDVLQPWNRIGPDESIATEIDWEAVEPLRLALLDRDFCRRTAPWPEIPAAISRRVMRRAHWLAFHLAVCGLRRVDDRLMMVLWHFADRWGIVTRDGVRLDIKLTHDLLAAVIGARRPSVSTALKRLVQEGSVEPRPRSRWMLHGEPPAELAAVHVTSRPPSARQHV